MVQNNKFIKVVDIWLYISKPILIFIKMYMRMWILFVIIKVSEEYINYSMFNYFEKIIFTIGSLIWILIPLDRYLLNIYYDYKRTLK